MLSERKDVLDAPTDLTEAVAVPVASVKSKREVISRVFHRKGVA